MSLYGALFGGVSGLRAQSSKIGVISDNIANVNTIGYKGGTAKFSSLVVNSNAAGSYQTGGVRGGTLQNISKQGLLQSTESATDIAISGAGFFVVKSVAESDVASTPLYTRAGSFTQDSLGNFINSQGFYLQGWPLDREGRLPGEAGNLNTTSFTNFDSLTTVNVESASGVATATSQIELGANLKAGEKIFPGQSGRISPDINNANNRNQPADAILVGSEYGLASSNSVRRGDGFTVATGNGLQYAYTYGGFTAGRNVTSALSSINYGDGAYDNTSPQNLNATTNIEYSSGSSFILTLPSHGLISGDSITLSGMTAKGNTPASELNAAHTITRLDSNRVLITVSTAHGQTSGTNPTPPTTVLNLDAATNIAYGAGASFIFTSTDHGLLDGDQITLAGLTDKGSTLAAELNTTHTITRLDDDRFSITVTTPHAQTVGTNPGAEAFTATVPVHDLFTADSRQFTGNIMDASSATQTFLGQIGTSGFSATALTFQVTSPTAGTVTFRYTTTAPNTLNGEFNNLTSLASAINSVTGLTARVVGGRLVVAGENANDGVLFSNGDAVGDETRRGIDWVGELDLQNISEGDGRRWASLSGLAAVVEADEGVSASITSPLSSATLDIRVDDPLDTITFNDLAQAPFAIPTGASAITIPAGTYAAGSSIDIVITDAAQPSYLNAGDMVYLSGLNSSTYGFAGGIPNGGPYQVIAKSAGDYTIRITVPQAVTLEGGSFNVASGNKVSVAGESNQGSVLAQLGLVNSLNGGTYTAQTTGALGPQYDPSGSVGKNMASGDITAQFSRNVRIYDSLGSGHDIRFSFIKIATNTWAVEAHVIPESEISTSLVDGQIALGNIVFNGDGTLRSVSASLTNPVTINWRNGSVPSSVSFDMGTSGEPFGTVGAAQIGLSDGLSQFDSGYNVNFANQNGAPVGQLVSVSITEEGVVVASYSNGETQSLYKLPIADFANPDGMRAVTGNVFTQTRESGEVNLRESGTNGTGSVVAAALEQSNVDLAEQLTEMIVAQRAYQANTKVIKTSDELLEQLNQI